MVAIRVCAWCKEGFDAIVGKDGIYCSPECERKANTEKNRRTLVPVCTPKKDTGKYFDEIPALSHDEFEQAITRVCRGRRKPRWQ